MKKFFFLFFLPFLCLGQSKIDEAKLLYEGKKFDEAKQVIHEILKDTPNDLEVIELLGDVYGQQKKWDEALKAYKKLLDANDKVANYHYKYGGVLGMKALENKLKALGFISDIKYAFKRAAELDPNHIDARWALVEFYMQLPGILGGSMSTALQYANELEAISKVDGYLAKGYIYEYDDEPEQAEKYYKLAIKLGGSITCYNKLTSLYEKENQPKKAIENIEATQKKHNRNALHYQLGKVAAIYNVELDKGEQCLKIYLKNYSLADGVPKAWAKFRLSQINFHKKEKSDALKYIDSAISELPDIDVFKDFKKKIISM